MDDLYEELETLFVRPLRSNWPMQLVELDALRKEKNRRTNAKRAYYQLGRKPGRPPSPLCPRGHAKTEVKDRLRCRECNRERARRNYTRKKKLPAGIST